ncbi:MAG: hypothetical protein ABIN97_10720 [Ginsengibacter sp.]
MKRIVIILGIMLVGIIALLENSGKHKRRISLLQDKEADYDDVWWDN